MTHKCSQTYLEVFVSELFPVNGLASCSVTVGEIALRRLDKQIRIKQNKSQLIVTCNVVAIQDSWVQQSDLIALCGYQHGFQQKYKIYSLPGS